MRVFRRNYYKMLSSNKPIGSFHLGQAYQFEGKGKILIEKANLGYFPSPLFWSSVGYLEARFENSEIVISKGVTINNGFTALALDRIKIGNNTLIGTNVCIFDSDFHSVSHVNGKRSIGKTKAVEIGSNCWIGSNVIILKGVELGDGCVVAAGSVVNKSFGNQSLIAGNPAILVQEISNV